MGVWDNQLVQIAASHGQSFNLHVACLREMFRNEESFRPIAPASIHSVMVQKHGTLPVSETRAKRIFE